MADAVPVELRARMDAAASGAVSAAELARAARGRLDAVLDLIAAGRGVREGNAGLNAASAELLTADALLTDAAARAVADGSLDDVWRALDLDALAERARMLDAEDA